MRFQTTTRRKFSNTSVMHIQTSVKYPHRNSLKCLNFATGQVNTTYNKLTRNGMKAAIISTAMLMLFATTAVSCGNDDYDSYTGQNVVNGTDNGESENDSTQQSNNNGQNEEEMTRKITISAGGANFTATLADNRTAQAFASLLPLTLDMNELNGNEKYFYLDSSLPADSSNPGTINTGDIMLYGSDCLVLFYKTFSTSYSYTRIGSVDNPQQLAEALGRGNVKVTFSAAE